MNWPTDVADQVDASTDELVLFVFQVQAFDNLIGPVVESLKFLSSLALDVLSCESSSSH